MTTRAPIPPVSLREAQLAEADARLVEAKHAFSLACLASARAAPDAVALTRQALQAVDAARASLAKLHDADVDAMGPKL